jgi:hypothetical protein
VNSTSKELAVSRVTDVHSSPFFGGGRDNNGIWILVILFIVFFIFNGGENFGFGNFGGCDCEGHRRHHHHHHHHHDECDNGINNIFGENGWFILIIFAVLFLFNDINGGANTNIINVDTDDAQD